MARAEMVNTVWNLLCLRCLSHIQMAISYVGLWSRTQGSQRDGWPLLFRLQGTSYQWCSRKSLSDKASLLINHYKWESGLLFLSGGLFPSHLHHAPSSQGRFVAQPSKRTTHNSSSLRPLCLTRIGGPVSPIWPKLHSLLEKLCQERFWDIILRMRWAYLDGY